MNAPDRATSGTGKLGISAKLGLIGKKLGMTQIFVKGGALVPVTVIQAGPCAVVQKRTEDKDGYFAVQLGFAETKAQRLSKAGREHRKKAGKMVGVLREFRAGAELEVGAEVKVADLFKEGDLVDVTGVTKGRGYQGVIKRHHFSGFPATHGTHEYFRHGGSIGNRTHPGRVFKNKRMAGQMGAERVTTQNLAVVGVRADDNVLLVRGAVPGGRNGILFIRPAVKSQGASRE
ncbi:MAG: 50S ribosomal protein L3 [Candidatus Binatia bacterium]|jgi:large subunit ribosomal protein L3